MVRSELKIKVLIVIIGVKNQGTNTITSFRFPDTGWLQQPVDEDLVSTICFLWTCFRTLTVKIWFVFWCLQTPSLSFLLVITIITIVVVVVTVIAIVVVDFPWMFLLTNWFFLSFFVADWAQNTKYLNSFFLSWFIYAFHIYRRFVVLEHESLRPEPPWTPQQTAGSQCVTASLSSTPSPGRRRQKKKKKNVFLPAQTAVSKLKKYNLWKKWTWETSQRETHF